MTRSKPKTAAPGNRLALPPEEQSRLGRFAQVAVKADLMQGRPPRFHDGMSVDDVVIITGLPRDEAIRRLREMQKQDDPKLYASRHLCAGAGEDYAKQEPQPTPAEAVLLPYWGEDHRAAPNALFRSALFPALSANQKENRRYLKDEEIFCVAGVKISFTGEQFDQSDLDVYLELLDMAREFPLGTTIPFSAHALLKALGLHTGGKEHARLHQVLIRLRGGTVDMEDHEKGYFGGLIEGGFRDKVSMNYEIQVNPKFAVLFAFGMWSKIDLRIRRALGRNSTAKALHMYYSTHINPLPHTVETLASIAGLTNSNKWQVKATLLKAHQALQEAGFLSGYEEAKNNTIKVEINHSPSQNRAIAKKAAEASKTGTRRRKTPTLVGELLPKLTPPKK